MEYNLQKKPQKTQKTRNEKLNHNAIHLKLTQYYKSTILQYKNLKMHQTLHLKWVNLLYRNYMSIKLVLRKINVSPLRAGLYLEQCLAHSKCLQ